MRESLLPFHRPSIGEGEASEVLEVLRSGWLTSGPKVRQFEAEFASYVHAPHAVATNSCTGALHLALAAIGLQPGDEVIVPTNTFTATAEVVVHLGGRPILADCDPHTFTLDTERLEPLITRRTRAIMPVHLAGHPCDMDAIMSLADRHGLKVIEDAAHALPSQYRGRPVGSIGDVTAFSFYATKCITTGEGGMATTRSAEVAERMRLLRSHGMSADARTREEAADRTSGGYTVVEAGFKYNMPDVLAAIGIPQLRRSDGFWERRRAIAQAYTGALSGVPSLITPAVVAGVQHAWHLYVVLLRLEALRLDREEFMAELRRRNIATSVHFRPLHLHSYYQRTFGYRSGQLRQAEWVYERCLSLPIYPAMTDEDVADVVEAVSDVAKRFRR
jgi:dTDP-4-amino-4,6-dideoxygalactose transaminase